MARPNDAPYPVAIDIHPDCDKMGLHVAVDFFVADVEPNLPVWDDALWDDTSTGAGWVGTEQWIDIAGDVQSCVIERTESDELSLPGTAQLTMTLDNSSGRYTQFSGSGLVTNLAVGNRIAIWFDNGIRDEWFLWGRIAVWEENYGIAGDRKSSDRLNTIAVTAYDSSFLLNQSIDGLTYELGYEGQGTADRIAYLATTAGITRGFKLDQGTVTHRNITSTNPFHESMQITAESDGGVTFIDNDGKVFFLNRVNLISGRDDQQNFPVLSDNCAPGTFMFWEGDPITDDEKLRNHVHLTNVDELMSHNVDQASVDKYGMRLMTLEQQTWQTMDQGMDLGAFLLNRFKDAYFRVSPIIWYGPGYPFLRVGDVVRYIRTLTNGARVDTNLVVSGTSWEYSPSQMTFKFSTYRVGSVNIFSRWDSAGWDQDVWSY